MSKTFSIKEMIEHNGRIAADLTNDMEGWDREFARSLAARYAQYGTNTFLSDKQEKQIARIFRTTGGMSAPAPTTQDKHGFDNADSDDDIPF